jgi:hypothetical protein
LPARTGDPWVNSPTESSALTTDVLAALKDNEMLAKEYHFQLGEVNVKKKMRSSKK